MNNSSLVQQLSLATFTPNAMSQEVLEGIFVQREELLRSVVQDLANSVKGARQYLLLVGARGMGKTHFVSMVYHRLKALPEIQRPKGLMLAWLREEEYGVNSWLYLVVEILRALELEGVEVKGAIAQLTGVSIVEAEYLANRLLLEAIGDRTLLIITENFDKLLAGLGDAEQFKFRSFLQENNCCSILATTPKITQDTSSRNKPFFGFFSRIDLPVFGHEDAIAMLVKIADLSGNRKLVQFLKTSEGIGRVRALHHLAGGNPRVYALFAQLITEESLAALLPAVTDLLDKLTPYYQSKIESLGQSDDQQRIVMFLARETRAVTVKEIANQCFISSERTTSTALKKLKEKGFVVSTQKGREAFYELSEVLMRLCLEMKNTRNGNLRLCVDFIRVWFRPQQQQEYLERLEAAGMLEHAAYFRQARSDASPHPVLLACIKDLQRSLEDKDGSTALQVWAELADFNGVSEVDRQRIADIIKIGDPNQVLAEIQSISQDPVATTESLYIEGLMFYERDEYLQALERFDRFLESEPGHFQAWFMRGVSLGRLGRNEDAITSFDKAIEFNPDDNDNRLLRGIVLELLVASWHSEGLAEFDRTNYPAALLAWQKTFTTIQQEQLSNSSDLIQEFLGEQLLAKFQQPAVRAVIPDIFSIYSTAQVLPELGVALIRNLSAIQSPTISDHTAAEWLKLWQELGADHPELALSLKLLAAGIQCKKNPQDSRVFLSIPQEMRSILREALGLPTDS
jgi:tetratricopeptide (TPR) repeat protein